MTVDAATLRRFVDRNDQVTEGIQELSRQIQHLDPKDCAQTCATVKAWAQHVFDLKGSLEDQQSLSVAMRESARIQDEQHSDARTWDKYHFIVDRLKADIRHFFQTLSEFVDLGRTWEDCVYDMELDVKNMCISSSTAEQVTFTVDTVVSLLNYRDKVISALLNGILYQKAVLDWDLKNERAYADGPMAEMAGQVVNIFSKIESLPFKFRNNTLPTASEVGHFTYVEKKQKADRNTPSELSPLLCRLITVLREMQSLDKSLRHMTFEAEVHITEKDSSSGKSMAADDLQREVLRWFDVYMRMEKELHLSRTQRNLSHEKQVEQFSTELSKKDSWYKQQTNQMYTLESQVQLLRHQLSNLRREKSELYEKNQRMAKESMPVIEQLKRLSVRSHEAEGALSTDVERLSVMFQMQAQENKRVQQDRVDLEKELAKVRGQMTAEEEKNKQKQEEVQKMETLYLRTMAARKSIHESYLERSAQVQAKEDRVQALLRERAHTEELIQERDDQIRKLGEDLARGKRRADELQQQMRNCLKEFSTRTGRPARDLTGVFKLPPNADTELLKFLKETEQC